MKCVFGFGLRGGDVTERIGQVSRRELQRVGRNFTQSTQRRAQSTQSGGVEQAKGAKGWGKFHAESRKGLSQRTQSHKASEERKELEQFHVKQRKLQRIAFA